MRSTFVALLATVLLAACGGGSDVQVTGPGGAGGSSPPVPGTAHFSGTATTTVTYVSSQYNGLNGTSSSITVPAKVDVNPIPTGDNTPAGTSFDMNFLGWNSAYDEGSFQTTTQYTGVRYWTFTVSGRTVSGNLVAVDGPAPPEMNSVTVRAETSPGAFGTVRAPFQHVDVNGTLDASDIAITLTGRVVANGTMADVRIDLTGHVYYPGL